MKARFAKFALAAGAVTAMALPFAAHAQTATPVSIEDTGGAIGLPNTDLKAAVLRTLSLVLALLGLVAVIMVVWGGFTWLTSGGDEGKVESAKKIISAAVIGLIVVLLSWAIVLFATKTTTNVIADPNANA